MGSSGYGARACGREPLPRGRRRPAPGELSPSVTRPFVIVPDPYGLHERLDDGRPYEPEPAFLQVLGEKVLVVELPGVRVERAELLAQDKQRLRVPNGGFDLRPIADDRLVFHQPGDVL